MTYVIKEQRNHRQKEMYKTSVVMKFSGHKTSTIFFSSWQARRLVKRHKGVFLSLLLSVCPGLNHTNLSWRESDTYK